MACPAGWAESRVREVRNGVISHRSSAERGNWTRAAFLLLMAWALGWQSYVVRTHVHWEASASPASFSAGPGPGEAPARDRHLPGAPDTCAICQLVAVAGHYLPPAPIVLIEPAGAATFYLTAARSPLFHRQRSHDWRSRAPPHHS